MKTAHPMCKSLEAKWGPIIEAHKAKPNTEIEFRFGRQCGARFDTNVGQATFEQVRKALNKYQEWESTKHTNSTVYYFEGSKRLTVDEETDEQVGQIKKRVQVDDFPLENAPLDVRLGVSTEEPFEYDGEETSTEQKTKERWSFVRKNLSIDLSIVKGNPDDKDADDDTVYQIEMEIVDPSALAAGPETFNLLHKIFDLLKCV
jgi:mRNA capping enzyme, beta chain